MNKKLILLTLLFSVVSFVRADIQAEDNETFEGYKVTDKGAWCWFADSRAIHYENGEGTINSSYIGYIDVHGNIKAMQHNFLTGVTNEVLVRSWFQPDDHNNPTFLVLPDERIMIFYSRHTDESCFYYRISQKPGDITTFGQEKRLVTNHNTTYPSAFILSDDPEHIYLCWRGINWHPTIARLTMPDDNDNMVFNWGPYQMVSYAGSGSRPYAKYASNGKDKIYMTFTTTHPDNQSVNYVYFTYIDVNTRQLIDVKENVVSNIAAGPHSINSNNTYTNAYPAVVVDNSPYRNWIWEVSMDSNEVPVIAMVRISEDKNTHHYYHAKWTGTEWKRTFLANGGGPFHQTPSIERCYSGGMALDPANPNIVYCSVPVTGNFGRVYELYKYSVGTDGSVTGEAVTKNSRKNNVRPFMLPNSENTPLRLTWMHGDYFDWIVSSQRPNGFPTAIHSDFEMPETLFDLDNGLLVYEDFSGDVNGTAYTENGLLVTARNTNITIEAPVAESFTISLKPYINNTTYFGEILKVGTLTYALSLGTNPKPFVMIADVKYDSNNVLGNSDVWKSQSRGTGGQWYTVSRFEFFNLTITYESGILTTYINGLIDQYIEVEGLTLDDVTIGGFDGWVEDCRIYNRALSQDEVKHSPFLKLLPDGFGFFFEAGFAQ